jgi:regulator of RNase E activity RraA
MTPLNPFDRFPDGRPRVPDELLDRLGHATTEQAWRVLDLEGYRYQFEGGWKETHPGRVTVGRAVTAQFIPFRPDYHNVVQTAGVAEGREGSGGQNSWVIETLGKRDVMVVDIFGKVKDGTVVGDNLGTAVKVRTGAGAVIDGGIRDLQGLRALSDVNFYMRGVDPTAIADVTLAGINIPIAIGVATVLPGDVVLGTPTGVIFIPPHLVGKVVDSAEDTLVRDEFGKMRLADGTYTSGDIDVSVWREEIEADFVAWRAARARQPR